MLMKFFVNIMEVFDSVNWHHDFQDEEGYLFRILLILKSVFLILLNFFLYLSTSRDNKIIGDHVLPNS